MTKNNGHRMLKAREMNIRLDKDDRDEVAVEEVTEHESSKTKTKTYCTSVEGRPARIFNDNLAEHIEELGGTIEVEEETEEGTEKEVKPNEEFLRQVKDLFAKLNAEVEEQVEGTYIDYDFKSRSVNSSDVDLPWKFKVCTPASMGQAAHKRRARKAKALLDDWDIGIRTVDCESKMTDEACSLLLDRGEGEGEEVEA